MAEIDIASVPREPDKAVEYVLNYILREWPNFVTGQTFRKRKLGELYEWVEVLKIAAERSGLEISMMNEIERLVNHVGAGNPDALSVRDCAESVTQAIRIKRIISHFDSHTTEATFTLDAEEIVKVSQLAAEMRDIVNASASFSDNHKSRLLDRISRVEIEVHKTNGRFDVILSGVVDFGDALGQFGKGVKPLVDRMTEIRGIAQKKSDEYKGLPGPDEKKRLPPPSKKSRKQKENKE